MQPIAIILSVIFCAVASGQEPNGSPRCGCLEEPAIGSHHKEKFCRHHLTPVSERNKPRSCICRPGLVRNSWGDCITIQECKRCKCFRDKDFNVCARACPVMCNEPIRGSCSKKCVFGCDCPPGYLRDPKKKYRCVKAAKCVLKCPQYSKFEFCVSTCAAKCGARPPRVCVTRCQRGGCVCDQGYAEVEHSGETICVPRGECYRYLGLAAPLTPGGPGNIGGGISSGGTAVLPGGVVGGAVGTSSTAAGGLTTESTGIVGLPSISGGGVGGTVGTTATGAGGHIPGSVGTVGVPSISGGGVGGTVGTISTGAGAFAPGSGGTGGVPFISGGTVGGAVGTVSTGVGGIHPGSVGSVGVPLIPGSVVGGTMGAVSTGVGVNRPGSVGTEGAPTTGTYGFGATSSAIYSEGIGPDDSMESGESRVGGGAIGSSTIHPGIEGPEAAGVSVGEEGTAPHGTSGVGGGLIAGGTTPSVIGGPGRLGVEVVTGTFGQNGASVFPHPASPGINTAVPSLSGSAGSQPNVVSIGSALTPPHVVTGGGIVSSGIPTTSTHTVNPVQPGTTVTGINSQGAGVSGAGGLAPVVSGPSIPAAPITNVIGATPGFAATGALGTPSLVTSSSGRVGPGLATALTPVTVPAISGGSIGGISATGSDLSTTGMPGPLPAGTFVTGTSSSLATGVGSSVVGVPSGGSGIGGTVAVAGGSNGVVSGGGTTLTGGNAVGTHLGASGSTVGTGRTSTGNAGRIAGAVLGAAAIPMVMAGVGAAAAGLTGLSSTGHHAGIACRGGSSGCMHTAHSTTGRAGCPTC
nr:WAG22 antigen-like [Dermacentor andersoni]